MAQVQESILNYGIVMMQLWPWDPTYFVISRVLIKHNWCSKIQNMSERVKLITSFFNSVMRSNAQRATNKTQPLDYKETLEVFENTTGSLAYHSLGQPILANNSGTSGYDGPGPSGSGPSGQGAGSGGGYNQQRRNFRGNQNRQAGGPPKRAEKDGKGFCYGYNSTRGGKCENSHAPGGCKTKTGVELWHRCNVRQQDGSICGARHRRKDH